MAAAAGNQGARKLLTLPRSPLPEPEDPNAAIARAAAPAPVLAPPRRRCWRWGFRGGSSRRPGRGEAQEYSRGGEHGEGAAPRSMDRRAEDLISHHLRVDSFSSSPSGTDEAVPLGCCFYVQTGEDVDVKLEKVKMKHPQLQYESKLYMLLQGGSQSAVIEQVNVLAFYT